MVYYLKIQDQNKKKIKIIINFYMLLMRHLLSALSFIFSIFFILFIVDIIIDDEQLQKKENKLTNNVFKKLFSIFIFRF